MPKNKFFWKNFHAVTFHTPASCRQSFIENAEFEKNVIHSLQGKTLKLCFQLSLSGFCPVFIPVYPAQACPVRNIY